MSPDDKKKLADRLIHNMWLKLTGQTKPGPPIVGYWLYPPWWTVHNECLNCPTWTNDECRCMLNE